MTVTVVIVTLNRPDCVKQCLQCLEAQEPRLSQVIVVDASADDRTEEVVADFTWVNYIRTSVGYGHMTASRNLGLAKATGNIVAFIDDDTFVKPGWHKHLVEAYSHASIGAVGGRALNNQPGEATTGVEEIGRLRRDGTLTGNFAADPGRIVEVDHIIGCNMSFRRSVLAELGGLREDYPGTEVREETDVSLRVRQLGYRVIFTPLAVAVHIGAPQVKGRRFDLRYIYYANRNHMVLLVRNYGALSGIVWRSMIATGITSTVDFVRRIGGTFLRGFVIIAGTFRGFMAGTWLLIKHGRNPVCRNAAASALEKRKLKEETSPVEKRKAVA